MSIWVGHPSSIQGQCIQAYTVSPVTEHYHFGYMRTLKLGRLVGKIQGVSIPNFVSHCDHEFVVCDAGVF